MLEKMWKVYFFHVVNLTWFVSKQFTRLNHFNQSISSFHSFVWFIQRWLPELPSPLLLSSVCIQRIVLAISKWGRGKLGINKWLTTTMSNQNHGYLCKPTIRIEHVNRSWRSRSLWYYWALSDHLRYSHSYVT